MHPVKPDILLAAAGQNNWSGYDEEFTGGVYLTENRGEHWQRVVDTHELFSSVEFCTHNPDVAYAGSSDAIYRSDDGGHTWQRFGRPGGTWGSPGIVAGFPIDMQCDPEDPMRVFVNNYLGGNFLSAVFISTKYMLARQMAVRLVSMSRQRSWFCSGRTANVGYQISNRVVISKRLEMAKITRWYFGPSGGSGGGIHIDPAKDLEKPVPKQFNVNSGWYIDQVEVQVLDITKSKSHLYKSSFASSSEGAGRLLTPEQRKGFDLHLRSGGQPCHRGGPAPHFRHDQHGPPEPRGSR